MRTASYILIILSSVFELACGKANVDPVQGKWAIRSQHMKSITYAGVDSNGRNWGRDVFIDSNDYANDTFAVNFSGSGGYVLTYPAGVAVTPTSAHTVWGMENGTYTVQGNALSITTARTGKVWQLFYGPGDSAISPLPLQYSGSDTLVLVSGWGVPGVIPFYYDSTVLIRVR